MDKGKIIKILVVNGLKPESFTKIEADGVIYASEAGKNYKFVNGKKYEIYNIPINDNKTIEEKQAILELIGKISDDIKFDDVVSQDKTTRTQEELDRIKAISKPRGWHFRDDFTDSEGNIYKKGILQ